MVSVPQRHGHLWVAAGLVVILTLVYKGSQTTTLVFKIDADGSDILVPRLGRKVMAVTHQHKDLTHQDQQLLFSSEKSTVQLLSDDIVHDDTDTQPAVVDLPKSQVGSFLPGAGSKSFAEWQQMIRAGCSMAADEESFLGKATKELPVMKHCLTLQKGASTLQWFQTAYESVYAVVGASGVAAFGWAAFQAYSFYKKCCASSEEPRV